MIHLVDGDPRDLLHAPPVGERVRPERVDAVLRRAVLIHNLARNHLRVSNVDTGERGERQDRKGRPHPCHDSLPQIAIVRTGRLHERSNSFTPGGLLSTFKGSSATRSTPIILRQLISC